MQQRVRAVLGKWSLCGDITGGNDAVWGDTPREWERGEDMGRFSQEYFTTSMFLGFKKKKLDPASTFLPRTISPPSKSSL